MEAVEFGHTEAVEGGILAAADMVLEGILAAEYDLEADPEERRKFAVEVGHNSARIVRLWELHTERGHIGLEVHPECWCPSHLVRHKKNRSLPKASSKSAPI